ncbi:hypothetical protein ACWC9U_30630 [Streptomyces sp. 900116325]
MAGTTAFVWLLLGGCGVAVVTVVARAKVDIARIQAKTCGRDSARRS